MPQTIDTVSFEQFKKDLDSLGFRFPVSRVSGDLKLAKGNISKYIKGNLKPSIPFLQKFYKFYKIEPGVGGQVDVLVENRNSDATNYQQKYINLLESQVTTLSTAIENNLVSISNGQKYLSAYVKASVQRSAERFVREDPAKVEGELGRIDKIYAQIVEGKEADKGVRSRGKM